MTTKLLNQEAARNIFTKGQAYDFFKKDGVHYTCTALMKEVNAQRSAIANLLVSKGSKCWSEVLTYCPEGEKMMKNANKELLEGKRISGAEMPAVDPDQAARMVEKAERQIANNKMAEKMAVNNQTFTR